LVEVSWFENDFSARLPLASQCHESEAVGQFVGFRLVGEFCFVSFNSWPHFAQFLFYVPNVVHVTGGGELLPFRVQNVFEDLFNVDSADVHQFDGIGQFICLEHRHA
jgi:hypothetical protein